MNITTMFYLAFLKIHYRFQFPIQKTNLYIFLGGPNPYDIRRPTPGGRKKKLQERDRRPVQNSHGGRRANVMARRRAHDGSGHGGKRGPTVQLLTSQTIPAFNGIFRRKHRTALLCFNDLGFGDDGGVDARGYS